MPRAWELVQGGGGGVMEGHSEKWPALRGSGRSQDTPEGGAVAWVSVGFRGRGCQERPHPQLLGPGTGSGREGGRRAEGRWEVAQGLKGDTLQPLMKTPVPTCLSLRTPEHSGRKLSGCSLGLER